MSEPDSPAKLRKRAKARLAQKAQHAVPGSVLFGDGVKAVTHGAEGWHLALGVTELAISAVVFIALIRAFRSLREQMKGGGVPHLHLGIDWVDIFLGAMLFTEVWAKYVETGHIKRPTVLLGFVMLFFGVFGGKFIAWKRRSSTTE
jgi:hypothetical protein